MIDFTLASNGQYDSRAGALDVGRLTSGSLISGRLTGGDRRLLLHEKRILIASNGFRSETTKKIRSSVPATLQGNCIFNVQLVKKIFLLIMRLVRFF